MAPDFQPHGLIKEKIQLNNMIKIVKFAITKSKAKYIHSILK